jgi:uncharacterized Rmd1/YagE family protein
MIKDGATNLTEALLLAINNNNDQIVNDILNTNKPIDHNVGLLRAAKKHNLNVCKMMVDRGATDFKSAIKCVDEYNERELYKYLKEEERKVTTENFKKMHLAETDDGVLNETSLELNVTPTQIDLSDHCKLKRITLICMENSFAMPILPRSIEEVTIKTLNEKLGYSTQIINPVILSNYPNLKIFDGNQCLYYLLDMRNWNGIFKSCHMKDFIELEIKKMPITNKNPMSFGLCDNKVSFIDGFNYHYPAGLSYDFLKYNYPISKSLMFHETGHCNQCSTHTQGILIDFNDPWGDGSYDLCIDCFRGKCGCNFNFI